MSPYPQQVAMLCLAEKVAKLSIESTVFEKTVKDTQPNSPTPSGRVLKQSTELIILSLKLLNQCAISSPHISGFRAKSYNLAAT